MNRIVIRLLLCLSFATITNVVGAQLREYSVETAKKDLAEGNADLILYSGISPSVYLYGDIGFIVDGVFWWLENTSRNDLIPLRHLIIF